MTFRPCLRGPASAALLLLLSCGGEGPFPEKRPPNDEDSANPDSLPPDTGPLPTDSGSAHVDADGDGFPEGEDCDDGDDTVYPGAFERCNDKDDDCDGIIDSDTEGWLDEDGDDYGTTAIAGCEDPGLPLGSAEGDCNDTDPTIHPTAAEVPCDGLDQDCDGLVAEVATVEGAASYTTIQAAIDEAPDGGTVWVCDGTWVERLSVAEGHALRIAGWSGSAEAVVFDGEELHPILIGEAGSNLSLEDLTFTRGYGLVDDDPKDEYPPEYGGAISIFSGSLTARRVHFTSNVSVTGGGAVFVSQKEEPSTTVSFEDCVFADNSAPYTPFDWHGESLELAPPGGSICFYGYTEDMLLSVTGSTFSGGIASNGGEISVGGTNQAEAVPFTARVEISDTTFASSFANYEGGAVEAGFQRRLASDSLEILIDNVSVEGAAAGNDGGGFALSGGTISVEGMTISDCSAGISGGGMSVDGDNVTVRDLTFSGCSAGSGGGGMSVEGENVNVQGVTFSNCSTGGYGGCMDIGDGTITIADSIFSDCSAGESGGGIVDSSTDGSLTLERTSFTGCSSGYVGGAIELYGFGTESYTFDEVSITDCTAAFQGGGLYLDGREQSTLLITNSSFERNNALNKGGGLAFDGTRLDSPATITIEDSIIRDNDTRLDEEYDQRWGGGIEIDGGVELSVDNCDLGEDSLDNWPNDLRIGDNSYDGLGAGAAFTCAPDDTCLGFP